MVLLSLFISFIIYFYNNYYFESRAILLCLVLIMDVFNHDKNIFKNKILTIKMETIF